MIVKRNFFRKKTTFPWLIFILVSLLLLTNCQNKTSHGNSSVTDLVTLTDALRRQGLSVTPVGSISQPFLSIAGTQSEVNGEVIEIFDYPDNPALKQDVADIQSDGTVNGTVVSWTSTPHFYQSGQVLVIYDGQNEVILSALEAVLGAPFASGKSP